MRPASQHLAVSLWAYGKMGHNPGASVLTAIANMGLGMMQVAILNSSSHEP